VYDIGDNPEFDAGRERGAAWANAALEPTDADPREVLSAERIEAAMGAARGDAAHGFLRGVRDVIMRLHPYERPNVIIEVAKSARPAGQPVQRKSVWSRIRGSSCGDED
jgi:hypothetical protein